MADPKHNRDGPAKEGGDDDDDALLAAFNDEISGILETQKTKVQVIERGEVKASHANANNTSEPAVVMFPPPLPPSTYIQYTLPNSSNKPATATATTSGPDAYATGLKRKQGDMTTTTTYSTASQQQPPDAQLDKSEEKKKIALRKKGDRVWEDKTLEEWPENDFRLFIGNLGSEVTQGMLDATFKLYPSFQKSKIIFNNITAASCGYGFISFLDPNDYLQAFRTWNNKYIGSRPVVLKKSEWKARSLDPDTNYMQK